ncbi:hypothetical protein Tco_0866261 [Tanacetum coccineum]
MSNNSETNSKISLSVFDVRSSDEESTPANDRLSKADGYHVVPPPITGNFLTLRADISFTGLDEYDIRKKIIASKTTKLNADTSKSKTSETIDNEDNVSEVQTVNPVKTNDQICQTSKKAGIGFKKIKACFVCLITLVKQNEKREVHKFSTARPVSTVRPFAPKIAQIVVLLGPSYTKNGQCKTKRLIFTYQEVLLHKTTFRPKDLKQDVKTFGVQNMTTAGTRAVNNTSKGKIDTDLKKSRDHAVVDSGCSSHMTGNKAYLSDYEDYNGGFVAFGSNHKGDELKCSSKAFRVYNKRTKRVEENQHIDFLEDQLNMTGTGPNWMFDLDFLTNSMNYIPVSVENQVNVDAGTQDSYVAGSSGKDKGPTQEYILLPLQPHRTRIPVEDVPPAAHEKPSESSPKDKDVQDSEDTANKESEQDLQDELDKMVTQELAMFQDKPLKKKRRELHLKRRSNTPYVSVASTPTCANAGKSSFFYLGGKIPIDASTLPNADLPIVPNMPDLEDASDTLLNDGIFNGAYDDDEDVGVVANFNNMDNTIAVSPIPTLRIHKDYPKGQILGDHTSAVQTRRKIQKASSAQQALVSYIYKQNRTNYKDRQNYLFACFLSQDEPKTISQALQDESWVEAMQEELLQFKL